MLRSFKILQKYHSLDYDIGVTTLANVVKRGQEDKAINSPNVRVLMAIRIEKEKTKEGDTT